jgi:hypothetical protein
VIAPDAAGGSRLFRVGLRACEPTTPTLQAFLAGWPSHDPEVPSDPSLPF